MKSNEEILDDPTLKVLTLSLLRKSLQRKDTSYWDTLYVLITLCKLREVETSIDIIIETDTFDQIRSLIESYNENLPLKAKNIVTDLVRSCISLFNYILYLCRIYGHSEIYKIDSVIEIAEELLHDQIYRNIQKVVEDETDLMFLESLRGTMEKEISSHAPILNAINEGTKIISSFYHTDLDDSSS